MFFEHLPQAGFICAHRGARSIAPENTLLAMRKALEYGAHCWETDVRVSREGELIIVHDPTLQRTTDASCQEKYRNRNPWKTEDFTVTELQDLDAGSWFLTADPFQTVASGVLTAADKRAIKGQKIPLLREVLAFAKTHHFPVNLEIKPLAGAPGDVLVVDLIIDLLRQTATTDLVLLSSFTHEYLLRARALHPTIALAVLAEKQHPVELLNHLHALSAAAYHPDKDLCSPELIKELQDAGFRVNCWTVNDPARARDMLESGMGVITDWPQLLTDKTRPGKTE